MKTALTAEAMPRTCLSFLSRRTPTAHPFALPPALQGPVLLLVTLLLFPGHHASPLSPLPPPQRRHSFFRCTGWGAGCSNLDYGFQPASRAQPRNHHGTYSAALPSGQGSRLRSASSHRPRGDYGLNFFFTSGHSWGASGKRDASSNGGWNDNTVFPTLDILKEAQLFRLHPSEK